MSDAAFTEIDAEIYCIDTGLYRPRHTASYLIRSGGELAFVDTGAANNVPRLLEVVREIGLTSEAVRYVMPTHVHLDHAGGAGALVAACPNATLITHEKGAPHMIDPSRLQQGATAVYGEDEFHRLYGDLEPVPESRVVAAAEGDRFPLGTREIRFIDTPGHANHHGCFFETETRTIFTGDTFGLSYREFDSTAGPWVIATTTPVAFDPDAWLDSLQRMMTLQPLAACPTHFGRLANPGDLVDDLRASIEAHRRIALREEADGDEAGRAERLNAAVDDLLVTAARQRQPALSAERSRELLQLDIDLNAQGLHVWLKRRAKAAAS